MRTVIIANPNAGAQKVRRHFQAYHQSLRAHFGSTGVRFTAGMGDATQLTRRAIQEGCQRIVALGGDGTANEVTNGFFDVDTGALINPDAQLAIVPVGTGCDLSRSLGFAGRPLDRALRDSDVRAMDVGRATLRGHDGGDRTRYFINISSFGASGLIVDRVNRSTKRWGGKASFLLGTARGMWEYTNQRVRLQVDDQFDQELVINTVAVANGRYFGGSMKIAPQALVDDGLFDVVVVGDVGLAKLTRYSGDIYKGLHVHRPEVAVHRGRVVTATPLGDAQVLIDLDGEQPGRLPVTYDLLARRLHVYAPWQRAEAVGCVHGGDASVEG